VDQQPERLPQRVARDLQLVADLLLDQPLAGPVPAGDDPLPQGVGEQLHGAGPVGQPPVSLQLAVHKALPTTLTSDIA
jgi:hypothetical protein